MIFLLTAGLCHAQDSSAFICFYPGENVPQFPGGDGAFVKYLEDSTRYPPEAKAMHKEGTVYIGFAVAGDGSIGEVYVRKGVPGAKALDEEALRVVSGMPDWTALWADRFHCGHKRFTRCST
ncbi:MAG TPA: TonB family protein [Bacteroidia bacterium]|nr:TonB family protein [Bacteroidia bacterium]